MAPARQQGNRTIAQVPERFDINHNPITAWKAQLEGGVQRFCAWQRCAGSPDRCEGAACRATNCICAEIGELTLEVEFLEGALTKMGVSASDDRLRS